MSFNASVGIPDSKGLKITKEIINRIGSPVVFDPFAGIGKTKKAVESAGGVYIGYEINPARYNRMIKA
jgi:DNA modification methylase